MYKICDDSVKPRQFLSTDTEDGIEAIFSKQQGYSLHEFIDGDDPLQLFIDFNLSKEKFDKIKPKLKLTAKEIWDLLYHAFKELCLKIYPDWNCKTLTIAIAVFTKLVHKKLPIDLQEKDIVDNIANKCSFSLQILRTPKFIKDTNEYSHLEYFKRKNINQRKESIRKNKIDARRIGSEVEYIEKLLEEYKIKGFEVLYSSLTLPNVFTLNSDQDMATGIKKLSLKLTLKISILEQKNSLLPPEKIKKPDDKLYFGMAPTLDFSKITINIVELGEEPIKLFSLIDHIYDSKVIIYDNIDFLPYSSNIEQPKNEFFNLFLEFKAKPVTSINYDLVNPII
ncbi:23157_t:CDS:2 [Cetraspora pellucida]|uniref:23157_t:CDS:1 n=1 Tax=Cetraspora pellucida TaxID=1433469 RepID=A0A9N8WI19_9GLOM|nr:23157_t:CDS:2 [Cetraspora pellucida]